MISYVEAKTSEEERKRLMQEVLHKCEFEPGDEVQLKGFGNYWFVVEDVKVVSKRDYISGNITLTVEVVTLRFNKSTQKFERELFSDKVLTKKTNA